MDKTTFPQLFLAPMTGYTDGDFCRKIVLQGAQGVILGGISVDARSELASQQIIKRGRKEFVWGTVEEIEGLLTKVKLEVSKLKNLKVMKGINIRASSPENFAKAASALSPFFDFIELNAHCRQPEFLELNIGQNLLSNISFLNDFINEYKKRVKVPLSLKIRSSVIQNPKDFVNDLSSVDILHVDAMLPGKPEADLTKLKDFADLFQGKIIGNNSVTTTGIALKMLNIGISAISIGRAALSNPLLFSEIKDRLK
ncbi:MAG: tRNA-dihydrouridine synthase [Candidatus Heimdallarchaeota archaeon]|nr:tRNA-dihydrouridine synthase [Candidatus Heimdallarchaeota archaeon]MCK5047953.1 tRNA-dihydrouridine synthase [Candidatus Heimdallarchaeota archaeon]